VVCGISVRALLIGFVIRYPLARGSFQGIQGLLDWIFRTRNVPEQEPIRYTMIGMAPYPSTTLANDFLRRANAEGQSLDHMKLQKLVYLAHGWHLALVDGVPLIEERVRAWEYGPVIRELYQEFAEFGRAPIDRLYMDFREWIEPSIPVEDAAAREVIDGVWQRYSPYSGLQLSSLTHQPETPWAITRQQNRKVIPDELIREYFRRLAA